MADPWSDAWDTSQVSSYTWDTSQPSTDSGTTPPTDTWNTPSSVAPAWDAEPDRAVNFTSNPHANEFPGIFTWDSHDELAATVIKCNTGATHYLRGSELGVGGYARVYKVIRQSDSRLFAGKTSTVVQKLVDEARVLRRYEHRHLLKYEGWYAEEGRSETTMLLTELCAGGNLHEYINEMCSAMPPGQILRVVTQIGSAFEYLHNQGLFHSDVKPRNIFIRSFSRMDVVLGDCADIKPVSYKGELLGTPGYYSPEIVARKKHVGAADDIWALGITMLGMMDQWPKVMYTREVGSKKDVRRIEKYPGQCWEHVQDLERLNGENGVVRLLGRMMAWGVERRVKAEEMRREAEALMGEWEGCEGLGMKVPQGFEQISFW